MKSSQTIGMRWQSQEHKKLHTGTKSAFPLQGLAADAWEIEQFERKMTALL